MGPLAIRLGGLTLATHEVFVVLGAATGFAVYLIEGRRRGMADRDHLAVAAGALLCGALMAKGATTWRYLLTTNDASAYGLLAFGGKSILGGLFGAYGGAELTKRIVGIRHSTGDLFAPAVAAGMAVGRIGCLLTEPVGTPTTLPWAISLSPAQAAVVPGCDVACQLPSHPSHAYEIAFHVISLILVVRYRDHFAKRGVMFRVWLLTYGVFRFGNEMLRENPDFWWGLSGSQLFLLVTVPLLAWGLWRTWRRGLLRPPTPGSLPVALVEASS